MLDTTLIGVLLFGISVIALQQDLASSQPKLSSANILLLSAILLVLFFVILPVLLLGIPAAVYFLSAAGITSASTLLAGYSVAIVLRRRAPSWERWIICVSILIAAASAVPALLRLFKSIHV